MQPHRLTKIIYTEQERENPDREFKENDTVTWLKTGIQFVIGFINHLQVVTTINYYTIAALHILQPSHTNLSTSFHGL
jgi:hypothetical protein